MTAVVDPSTRSQDGNPRTSSAAGAGSLPADAAAVLSAAQRRGKALAERDEATLRELLHPAFGWQSYRGEYLDLEAYLASNLTRLQWREQRLDDAQVEVVGDAAVLRCTVSDVVDVDGVATTFRMPMTQTWVRTSAGWQLLAGHAGPRLS